MKRLFFLFTICLVALALPAAAAASSRTPRQAPVPVDTVVGAREQTSAATVSTPLARALSGTISGTLLTFAGAADSGATVDWYVGSSGSGSATTDASGQFSFADVPAAAGDGEIQIRPADGNRYFDIWNLTWDGGKDFGTLQPGGLEVSVTETTDDYWTGWSTMDVDLYDEDEAGPTTLSVTAITANPSPSPSGTPTVTTGMAEALTTDGDLDAGAVYYWLNQGQEIPVDGTAITPGVEASPSAGLITADQSDAQGFWFDDDWTSGKPGSRIRLAFENFTKDWQNAITGQSEWPSNAAVTSFGTWTPADEAPTDEQYKRITIPSTAAVGYRYWVRVQHTDGPLLLRNWYQTCSLNSTRTAIRRGARVKLSGVVPVSGHWGATAGTPKRVSIYKTTSRVTASKGQPGKSGGAYRVSGWTRVARVTANGLGRYTGAYMRPGRTTWYAVWYPADDYYYGSWTSLRKVTVR